MTLPNILILMTDQQRWDSLGIYGAPEANTPNLDRLAKQGARFTRCYCNNPICTPSRASLLTGGELPDHGVMRLEDVLDDSKMMFPELLRHQGYRTALFGKQHVSSRMVEHHRRHPLDGFEIYDWCHEPAIHTDSPYNAYARWLQKKAPAFLAELGQRGRGVGHFPSAHHATRWTAEATMDFLKDQAGQPRPFFCMASVFDPHDPYDDYPLEYAERIPHDRIREPVPASGDDKMPAGIILEREWCYMKKKAKDAKSIRQARLGYHASIAFIDEQFGRILDCLETTGQADNTIVIFTSDHGDMLGDHGLMAKGAFFYEPCTHVPLLMRWPAKIAAGTELDGLVQLNDIAATLTEAAQVPASVREQYMPSSLSLLPYVTVPDAGPVRDTAICAYRHTGYGSGPDGVGTYIPVSATMLRQGDYKLCLYHDDGTGEIAAEGQLFDLAEDPEERNDLWESPAHLAIKQGMIRLIENWIDVREGGLTRFSSDSLPRHLSGSA
ncbi:MAG: sulfatase-like hydrolase/transferase [Verrucomicrobiota bacterium JB024]|nr:sulfatase-like hydrolase/transferase [Verrucomicrobiota bacterium JB024]